MNCRFLDLAGEAVPGEGRVGAKSWRGLLDRAGILPASPAGGVSGKDPEVAATKSAEVLILHGVAAEQAQQAWQQVEAATARRWVLLDPIPPGGEHEPSISPWGELLRGAHRILTTSQGGARRLARDLTEPERLIRLSPFLDTADVVAARHHRASVRRRIAGTCFFPESEIWIVSPAPRHSGRSMAVLARALEHMVNLPWRVLLIGPEADSSAARGIFARVPRQRLRVFPMADPGAAGGLELWACGDLFLWPAIEDSGLASMLQAITAGLPVVAGDTLETRARVQDAVTGRLTGAESPMALAKAADFLIRHEDYRAKFARQAEDSALAYHEMGAVARGAARVLADITS